MLGSAPPIGRSVGQFPPQTNARFTLLPADCTEMLALWEEGRHHWLPRACMQEVIPFPMHHRVGRRPARERLLGLLQGPHGVISQTYTIWCVFYTTYLSVVPCSRFAGPSGRQNPCQKAELEKVQAIGGHQGSSNAGRVCLVTGRAYLTLALIV